MTEDEKAGCINDSKDMSLSKLQETAKDREIGILRSMDCKESDTTEWLNNNFYYTCGGFIFIFGKTNTII